mgnify:CR=1 FL=1
MTLTEIRDRTRGHWWDQDSMRFFGTRASEIVYTGKGGTFFVTSERPPSGKRAFSIRQFVPDPDDLGGKGTIETVGVFCAYTRGQAHILASRYAEGGGHVPE